MSKASKGVDPQNSFKDESRKDGRLPAEEGSTVIVNCGEREFIGAIENRSDNGFGIRTPESLKQSLEENELIDLTYSMPYGLVNQTVQIRWSRIDGSGGLKIGASVSETDDDSQSNYQKLWKKFTESDDLENAAGYWLRLQCAMISGVTRGVVVLGKPDSGSFAPVCFWPKGQRGTLGLTEVAELALHEKRGVLRDRGQIDTVFKFPICYLGYPLMIDDRLYGVVAIEMMSRPQNIMRAIMRQIQWGASWVEVNIRRREGKKYSPENQQLVTVLELIASTIEHEKFQEAATAVATEIATLLKCERVSIGFLKGKYIEVKALSHSANFAQKSNLIHNIGSAMDEAMDQQTSLVFPAMEGEAVKVLKSHGKLIGAEKSSSVCTIPLSLQGQVFGAMTLEHGSGKVFDRKTLELCETIGSMVGPILEAKRKEDRWLITKVWLSIKQFVLRLIGPAHAGLKLATLLFIAFLSFCFVATGDYRVTADTHLEGAIQRVIVTPFDGYVSEAYVRAGDIVKKDTPLLKFDDRELNLERIKWESQKEQYIKEHRNALGKAERSKISVLTAQLGQVDAQLALIEAQLSRVLVQAPFDGVIVSGDLSQSLGAPSQRGDVLFEIAPLDAYRVILEVDERNIADIRVGQGGDLVLTGRSDRVIPFKITKITPVSESNEGRNYFRVEAELEETYRFLRPGMNGVGKVMIGERKLIWIWSKGLIDWLRLTLWTWWPTGL